MSMLELKIVPNERPNADGEWIIQEVPDGVKPFDFEPREGYHVVAYALHYGYPAQDGAGA